MRSRPIAVEIDAGMADIGRAMTDSSSFTRTCHVVGAASFRARRARKDTTVPVTHELTASIARIAGPQAPFCLRIVGLEGRTLDLRVAKNRLWRAAMAMSGDGRGLIPVTEGNIGDLLEGRLQLGRGESIFSPVGIAFEPGIGMQVLSEGFEGCQVLLHDFCADLLFVDDVLHVSCSVPRRDIWFPPGHGRSATRMVLGVALGPASRDFSVQFGLHAERELQAFLAFQSQRHGIEPEMNGSIVELEGFDRLPLEADSVPVEQVVSILSSFGRQHALATELSDDAFECWVRTREAMEAEDMEGMIVGFADLCETGVGDARLFRAAAHAAALMEGFLTSRPEQAALHDVAARLDLFEWARP